MMLVIVMIETMMKIIYTETDNRQKHKNTGKGQKRKSKKREETNPTKNIHDDETTRSQVQIEGDIRGCPHMMSAILGGLQTPPPPLVSNRQQMPYPPSPPRQQWSAFARRPFCTSILDVDIFAL